MILEQLSGESFDAAINNPDDYLGVLSHSEAKARAAICTLVLEDIIGEDEEPGAFFNKNSKKNLRPRYKNMLRAEQRLKLGDE